MLTSPENADDIKMMEQNKNGESKRVTIPLTAGGVKRRKIWKEIP